ncbi:MAG: hypothetical protein JST64_07045 [Actinobacteria bacterium]|nr:hypothetical protein [Actinomycetota bacterium]
MSDQPQGEGWWLASDGRYYPPDRAATPPPVPHGSVPGPSPTAVLGPADPPWAGPASGSGTWGTGASSKGHAGSESPALWLLRGAAVLLLLAGLVTGIALVAIKGAPAFDPRDSFGGSSSSGDPHPYAGDGALLIFFAILQCVVLIPAAPKIVGQRDTVT